MVSTATFAQNIHGDANGDLEVNIADVNTVIDLIFGGNGNQMAADVNMDGEINIADINAIIDIILGGNEGNEGGVVEPTEMEIQISELTSDEDAAPEVIYSEADSLLYDELAQEVLMLFAPEDSDENEYMSFKFKAESEDDLAEEAIRNNGINIFDNSLKIEQQDWNSGLWGKTRYGGFETYYNTHIKNGKRCLLVVFYHKGGFPNTKTAYLKLGQVNSGKILGKITIPIKKEYVYLNVQIDDYLNRHGFINFFPLVINSSSKAREYINPIMVETDPIVENDWNNKYYGYEFGTINGVSVYYNNNYTNAGGAYYQCVELCKRYVTRLNSSICHPYENNDWGNAINWPYNRAHDRYDPGEYMVYANNGNTRVREGDLIVWDHQPLGHIGVVINTTKKYIRVAHQNGGIKKYALPIGTYLKIDDNGVVKDIEPETNESPIFTSRQPINYLIRIHNEFEDISAYNRSMKASTTKLYFTNKVRTRKFTVANSGMYPLTISCMMFYKGKSFSIKESSCTISPGATHEFEVTYTPTASGDDEDYLVIRSNADDNPEWIIRLSVPNEAYANYTPDNKTLTFYYDTERSSRSGTTYSMNTGYEQPDWFISYWWEEGPSPVTKVVFDPSFAQARPTTTFRWFDEMYSLESITGLNNLNTSKVTNMSYMFADCQSLTSLDLSTFNTSNVTDMKRMFNQCYGLSNLNLRTWDTSNVTNMSSMFCLCYSLTNLDLSSFNTEHVTDMGAMFIHCRGLTSIDLSHFNTTNVTKMTSMFNTCNNLTTIYVGNYWDTAAAIESKNMFLDCYRIIGGRGTTYDANHIDKAYAHIDGGPSNPGYLTAGH